MAKITAIMAGIGLFFTRAWKIIRALKELKAVKKEIIEAYDEGKEALEIAQQTVNDIKKYFTDDSDGGKKLTAKELKEGIGKIERLINEIKEASVETIEAKDKLKEVIEKIKQKKG